jgi:hypothetical protein
MHRRSLVTTLLALVVACSGDNGTGPDGQPDPSDAPLSASIDGSLFEAGFATVQRSGSQVLINGAGLPQRAIGFQVPDTGPGTFTFGAGNNASAGVTIGSAAWIAGGGIGSGSVTVTTSTSNRIAGTFQFSVVAQGGQSPNTMAITNGRFDITF